MSSIASRNRSTPLADNGSRPQTTPPTHFLRMKQRVHDIIYEPKPALLQLLSLILTLQTFLISSIWYISTLPIRITAYFYEHWFRALFPKLPSVRKLLTLLRSAVLSLLPEPDPEPAGHGETSSGAGSNPNRTNHLQTLNVDLNAIRAGGT